VGVSGVSHSAVQPQGLFHLGNVTATDDEVQMNLLVHVLLGIGNL
jgi:hypothetical protein